MRIILGCCLALLLTNCISPKKAAERYQPQIDQLQQQVEVQQDSISTLRLALERSRGGNDMLLETQDRLQDRLAKQDDELEQLRGNYTATSTQMNRQITELRQTVVNTESQMDSLIIAQARAIGQYSDGLKRAAGQMSDSLTIRLPNGNYQIEERPGEIILSVQEDVLFRSKSVENLSNDSHEVLRVITDALQANPLLKINIVGHTDNQPNPRRGTDNWEYGALRATRLANELEASYYVSPNRIIAASQGEYSPATSNATEEGRSRNRRIDFVLTSSINNLLRELDKVVEIRE